MQPPQKMWIDESIDTLIRVTFSGIIPQSNKIYENNLYIAWEAELRGKYRFICTRFSTTFFLFSPLRLHTGCTILLVKVSPKEEHNTLKKILPGEKRTQKDFPYTACIVKEATLKQWIHFSSITTPVKNVCYRKLINLVWKHLEV